MGGLASAGKAALGEKHPSVADSYNNIGLVYASQGHYKEALEHYQKGLRLRIAALGEQHPHVADSYNNIGLVYASQGHYKEALEHYQQALSIYQNTVRLNHPHAQMAIRNLELLRLRLLLTQSGNAEGDQKQAAQRSDVQNDLMVQFSQGAVSTEDAAMQQAMAASCDSEAEACLKRGDHTQAQEHYQQALKTRQEIHGDKPHADIAKSCYNLGQVHLVQKNYQAAAEHLRKAHKLYSECLGEEHATTQQAAKALENVYLLFSAQEEDAA